MNNARGCPREGGIIIADPLTLTGPCKSVLSNCGAGLPTDSAAAADVPRLLRVRPRRRPAHLPPAAHDSPALTD